MDHLAYMKLKTAVTMDPTMVTMDPTKHRLNLEMEIRTSVVCVADVNEAKMKPRFKKTLLGNWGNNPNKKTR